MIAELEKLLILQHCDQQIRDVNHALQQLPQEKAACERELLTAERRLEEVRSRQRDLEMELKKLDGDILAKQDQIARYRTQQLQTRKNDEYAALNHEIAAGEKVIATIEERQIVLLEAAEPLALDVEIAQAAYAIELQRIGKVTGALEGQRENLLLRHEELLQERPRLTEGIEEDLLDRYDRLFKSKAGAAIVPIENNICTGCHMKVTTQTVLLARAEKEMISCSQCGRILYNDEDTLMLQRE